MSGHDTVLWIMTGAGALLIPIGLWMKHDIDKLDRRIEAAEARRAAERHAHPAE